MKGMLKFADGMYGERTQFKIVAGASLDSNNTPNRKILLLENIL